MIILNGKGYNEKLVKTAVGASEEKDKIHFSHDGKTYIMSEDEIEAAYRYRQRQYLLEDAKRNLNIFVFGYDDGSDFDSPKNGAREKAAFQNEYGLPYEKAVGPDMLERYMEKFSERFSCDLDEFGQWEDAISGVLSETVSQAS